MKREIILVSVDPMRHQHPALERVMLNAKSSEVKPEIHLFVAVDKGANESKVSNGRSFTSLGAINDLRMSVECQGFPCECEIYWEDQWQKGMLDAAKRIRADIIVMTDHSNVSRNIFLADSKWRLLREARRPVMLVRKEASCERKTVLAAVNIQVKYEQYKDLNQRILNSARVMAEHYGSEFHVVNAYEDSMSYPDRGRLLRKANTVTSNVHVKQGSPEQVVSTVANEIGADIVVMGTMARKGAMESIRGNTSERVLNTLQHHDVLTIN